MDDHNDVLHNWQGTARKDIIKKFLLSEFFEFFFLCACVCVCMCVCVSVCVKLSVSLYVFFVVVFLHFCLFCFVLYFVILSPSLKEQPVPCIVSKSQFWHPLKYTHSQLHTPPTPSTNKNQLRCMSAKDTVQLCMNNTSISTTINSTVRYEISCNFYLLIQLLDDL